ncbi:MAG: hypothetical protein JNM86_11605 [Phycisphaerae bacterium]|nr:hypothetical protein [Phycisphaerae bacterium]
MRRLLLGMTATCLLSISATAQQFQYLTQSRAIKAQSVAMPEQLASAPDFNVFTATVISAGTPEAQSNGYAQASQNSTLGATQITGSGFANRGKSNDYFFGYGTAYSNFHVTFTVAQNTQVNFVTNFARASVSLSGPGIGFYHSSSGSSNESGVLLAGQTYTLHADTMGEIQSGNSVAGNFSFTLKLSGYPAVPTSPQSSATSPVCPGADVWLSVADPGAGYAIDWYTDSVLIGTGASLLVHPTVGPEQIYYARTRRVSDGVVSLQLATVSVPVKYATSPTAASTSRDNLCQYDGGTIQLTASGGAGADFEWFAGSCAGTPIGTGASITIPAPHATTTYYVRRVDDCASSSCISRVVQVRACPGDFTCDEIIADDDFVSFASAYEILLCGDLSMPAGCPADLNADGFVDDSDFVLFAVAYDALACP